MDEPSDRAELHGTWSVFGSSQRVDGRLRLRAGRDGLELERSLLTPAQPRLPDRITVEGELLNGQPVTLLDCGLRSRRKIVSGERYIETWTVGQSILGAH